MSDLLLEKCYRNCEAIARESSFYRGFSLLPASKRRAFSAVYAFMRHSDDISDDEGLREEKEIEFARWRSQLNDALDGRIEDHPTLPALRDTVERYQIPREYLVRVVQGTEMDLTNTRYQTFEDLRQYCYSVASVVGLICIQIFGYRGDDARECAEACGVAFQLTNIMRDLKEDLERDRIYLPQEDLERFHYSSEDLQRQLQNECYHALMSFQDHRAGEYYAKAWPLVEMIEPDSRRAFRAIFNSYHTILTRIRNRNYDVFSGRVRLRTVDKVAILVKAFL